jgi:hypothetical protein
MTALPIPPFAEHSVYEIEPVLAILDTHLMARNMFKANSIFLNRAPPMTSFNLGALLAELKCPHETSDLHNAGNDATFTLHAMVMLAIKGSESREMNLAERENLKCLLAFAQLSTLGTNSSSSGLLCTRVS